MKKSPFVILKCALIVGAICTQKKSTNKSDANGAMKNMKKKCMQCMAMNGEKGEVQERMNKEDWQYLWGIRDKRDRKKVNQRWMDRWYFKKVLPKKMYDKYEIHHNWANGAICYLLTPWAHRGAKYKGNRKK